MRIKKIIILAVSVLFGAFLLAEYDKTANANPPYNHLNEQIKSASHTLQMAEEDIKRKVPELFRIYQQWTYNEEGHAAELKIRELYPKEYWNWVEARGKLDDLKYMKFMIFANAECDKE